MYTLLKTTGIKSALAAELPGMVVALVIAQLFFKWGSFSLELVGFLATWWVASFLKAKLQELVTRPTD